MLLSKSLSVTQQVSIFNGIITSIGNLVMLISWFENINSLSKDYCKYYFLRQHKQHEMREEIL